MKTRRALPSVAYVYLGLIAVGGAAAIALSYRSLVVAPPAFGWLALAALTWLSGTFAIKIPSAAATISVSEVFVFSLAILFGGPAATITVAIDGFLSSLYRGNYTPRRLIFNIAEPALSTALAYFLYQQVGRIPPLSIAPAALPSLVGPVFVFAVGYLLLNTSLTAIAMAWESGASVVTVWRKHIVWLSVNFGAGASIATLLAVNMRQVSLQGLLLILPLVLLLYLVFRTWTARIHEAADHVASINRLYLSTVEALAVAIESKDQVTHSHVRRVQTLSLAIADRIGITDAVERRAIEAGALLHDIGKVAVPDYLLNKPGKLTPEEYELIKLHAPMGSEILKAVDFPYPVAPIVRHHHENWNGTGYPDRIAGETIPIGARIISVVDCFDALTSDRPYRRALSDEEAIGIILERRGTMYAPTVVDALVACYREVRPILDSFQPDAASLLVARFHERPSVHVEQAPVTAPESIPTPFTALDDLLSMLSAEVRGDEGRLRVVVPTIAGVLRTVTPATTVCLGVVNASAQTLDVAHAFGHGEQLLKGSAIRIGDGISGWVAANGTVVINSDPALDFPEAFAGLTPRLTAALVVPIGASGVLSLYTDRAGGFEAVHRDVAEQAAQRLALALTPPVARAATAAPSGRRPADTPSASAALMMAAVPAGSSSAIVCVSLAADRPDGTDTAALAALVLPSLRLSDSLIATSDDEILALLPGCEPEAEYLIRERLQAALDAGDPGLGDLSVGFAVTPHDGATFADGVRAARGRRRVLYGRGQGQLTAVLSDEGRRA